MGIAEAKAALAGARDNLIGAFVLIMHAATDPSPAAGPRGAAASGPLNAASTLLLVAATDVPEGYKSAVRLMSDDARNMATSALAIAFIPWPFVYGALAALAQSVRNLTTEVEKVIALLDKPRAPDERTPDATREGPDANDVAPFEYVAQAPSIEALKPALHVVRVEIAGAEGATTSLEIRNAHQIPFARAQDAEAIAHRIEAATGWKAAAFALA